MYKRQLDKDGTHKTAYTTSWGVSTRLIGAIIMTHGDDNGLVLPPAVAPVQAVIIPVAQHKPGVLERCGALRDELAKDFRVKLDDSDNSAGWKYAEYEMKGVPVRIELGPHDIEAGQCVLALRHSGEKRTVPLENVSAALAQALEDVRSGMYSAALANRASRTYDCATAEEILSTLAEKGDGFVRAPWCGDEACEIRMKEEAGMTSRCIPFAQQHLADTCAICGKPAKHMLYWGRQY